jgi:uncharacterized protein
MKLWALFVLLNSAAFLAAQTPDRTGTTLHALSRFKLHQPGQLAIRSDIMAPKPFTVTGPRGALLGQQDGSLEAWIFPWKILSDLRIQADVKDYPVPIDVNQQAATIEVRPGHTQGKNVLPGLHAYSYANALSSAMQAYLTLNSTKHLAAAKNAFQMIQETQSFATGGWGPDEMFVGPASGALGESLTKTHSSFETPCGSYAHFKLTRYLLRVTGEARYGDSMERVMYNTVLGAKALQPDGRAFYYSDYNMEGIKVYYRNAWPCCSGTLPEVAADYRINTYFQSADGVLVNLYIPSTLRWRQKGAQFSLTQSGSYPFADQVQFTLTGDHHAEFSIAFRIPEWAQEGASIQVNGKAVPALVAAGSFANVHRTWKNGDRILLTLPMSLRLEAVDAQHPDTVALVYVPLVLFPLTDAAPALTRAQLLSATTTNNQGGEWSAGSLRLRSFQTIGEEKYSTYLKVE